MTPRELLNLVDWLRAQGMSNDKVVECLEAVEGRKIILQDTSADTKKQE